MDCVFGQGSSSNSEERNLIYDSTVDNVNSKSIKVVCGSVLCTYSIALYTVLSTSGDPSTVKVKINGSDELDLTFPDLEANRKSYYYKIFANANATGQTVLTSPLMLTYNQLTNPCESILCEYSVVIYSIESDPLLLSVYINGKAVIYNFSTTNEPKNFPISQEDFLQIFVNFDNSDYTSAIFYLYNRPNGQGSPFWGSFGDYSGPPDFSSVPNFCHETLTLELYLSSKTPVGGFLSVSVVPSLLASSPFQVLLSLICE